MSSTLNSRLFLTTFVNNCSIVKSSRLDKTLKAVINKYSKNEIESLDSSFLISYLNKLRIIYYLKRLDYFNKAKSLRYRGNYSSSTLASYKLTSIGLIEATFKEKKTLNLDYSIDILEASKDPLLNEELYYLNIYILKYSLIFRDLRK